MTESESIVKKLLRDGGFRVLANGWPDFCAFNSDRNTLLFVEVKKGAKEKITYDQRQMHNMLRKAGIKVSVVRTENAAELHLFRTFITEVTYTRSLSSESVMPSLPFETITIDSVRRARSLSNEYPKIDTGQLHHIFGQTTNVTLWIRKRHGFPLPIEIVRSHNNGRVRARYWDTRDIELWIANGKLKRALEEYDKLDTLGFIPEKPPGWLRMESGVRPSCGRVG